MVYSFDSVFHGKGKVGKEISLAWASLNNVGSLWAMKGDLYLPGVWPWVIREGRYWFGES